MSNATRRAVVRWVHVALGVPIVGYVYSPYESLPAFASAVRLFFLQVLVLSGLWLWKGHAVRRLFTGKATAPRAPD